MQSIVYVYNGPGASDTSVQQTVSLFQRFLYSVKTINAKEVCAGQWRLDAALFVLPGGADVPYVKDLTPNGNEQIQAYVHAGGSFLGICAGSYYASSFVEFAKGTDLEVVGSRELALFKGSVIGPYLRQYDYKTNSGACSANISLEEYDLQVFYQGGGYFEIQNETEIEVIAWYKVEHKRTKPAIIGLSYGAGRVVLSGVHPEYDPELLDKKDAYLAPIASKLKGFETKRMQLMKHLLQRLLQGE